MERGKGSTGRGGKNKAPHPPADLFALGSKSTSENKARPGAHAPSKVGVTHGVYLKCFHRIWSFVLIIIGTKKLRN